MDPFRWRGSPDSPPDARRASWVLSTPSPSLVLHTLLGEDAPELPGGLGMLASLLEGLLLLSQNALSWGPARDTPALGLAP